MVVSVVRDVAAVLRRSIEHSKVSLAGPLEGDRFVHPSSKILRAPQSLPLLFVLPVKVRQLFF